MLTIDLLQDKDIEQILHIEKKAHLVPWTLSNLKNCQGDQYVNLLLRQNTQLVGFAICQRVLDEATLLNIAIDPLQQQQGYGKFLLNELIKKLQQQKIATLWLEVRVSNEKAIKLYERLNFKRKGQRKDYYPTQTKLREDAWVMARDLTV